MECITSLGLIFDPRILTSQSINKAWEFFLYHVSYYWCFIHSKWHWWTQTMALLCLGNLVGSFLTGLSFFFPTLAHLAFCCPVHLPKVFSHREKQTRSDLVSLISLWWNFGATPQLHWASNSPVSHGHKHPYHPYLKELLKEPNEAGSASKISWKHTSSFRYKLL